MSRISTLPVAVTAVAVALSTAPLTSAAPDLTDLSGLNPVATDTYGTYSTYGAGGWQFATPDGLHCRIMTVTRWGSPPKATCWGALPGVTGTTNTAFATAPWPGYGDQPKSGLDTVDLKDHETYRSYEHRSGDVVDQVDPASYHLLPVGSRLVLKDGDDTVTCGVPTQHTVLCSIDGTDSTTGPWQYGFVISPDGSHTL